MLNLGEAGLIEHIKSVGLYRSKAKHVMELAAQLCQKYGDSAGSVDFSVFSIEKLGKFPRTREEFMELSGVGRKTANVVLAEAFGEQRIAVDTHVFRVANRIGIVSADNVLDTELGLQRAVPRDNWTKLHHALIWHGRRVCAARRPDCENCCILSLCKRNGVK